MYFNFTLYPKLKRITLQQDKGGIYLFIYYYLKSVLLLWTKHRLLDVMCGLNRQTDLMFFLNFFPPFVQCALSCLLPYFGVPPLSLAMGCIH